MKRADPGLRITRSAFVPAVVRVLLVALWWPTSLLGAAPRILEPAPSPVDNPMKGLVPYAGMAPERFPHSLEFEYIPLNEIMRGPDEFDWQPVERRLGPIGERGCQAIFRVWLEYPDKDESGMPKFLLDDGVTVTRWRDGEVDHATPDYTDERLVSALERFIVAFGRKFDGDPRLGYLTAGLLGAWGEWHTAPRDDMFAPKAVQERVMSAYETAFTKTPVLLRYPAGKHHPRLAANAARPFGYHDDSFAWATLPTNRAQDAWFFLPSLVAAGASEKWRTHPIGGEIRPELWGLIFDAQPAHPKAQDLAECLRQSHVTWLMDSGLFRAPSSPDRLARASTTVRHMGYDFVVTEVDINLPTVTITIQNQGIAPFYANWPPELATLDPHGHVSRRWATQWQLGPIQPGARAIFSTTLPNAAPGDLLALRGPNPLPNGKGKPLRFANATQDAQAPGWLTLGRL